VSSRRTPNPPAASRYTDRLTILDDQEIEALYGRPRFNHDERVHFFGLTPEERALADRHYTLANRVLFILQVGYFKAKTLFFAFELDEVREDARHVLQRYYPGGDPAELAAPVLKQTRHAQQRKILDLFGFRACQTDERGALMEKAGQLVRVSPKPIFLFRNLLQHLEQRRIVVPGYSFLQDLVSQALAAERARLTGILDQRLDTATLKALDALYVAREGTYAITPLKRDPKDFSLREMKREIARSQALEPLYRTAQALLPELGLSNDSLAYYAALVDYYTVQKLQQLPAGMARLYLVCFLLQRYRKINDNLVQALIYQVRKVEGTAKIAMEQQVLAFQREGHANLERLGQILNLFLDPGIADSVSFGEIKQRAFGILKPEPFQRATQYLNDQALDTTAVEWEFIAALAPSFKQHLRPLVLHLPLRGHREDDSLMAAVAFLRKCFRQGKSPARYSFKKVPKTFIPEGMKAYMFEKAPDGRRRIHPDKYEFLVYRLLRHRLEAGDIYVADSLRFRSFDEDLIPRDIWQRDQAKILQEIDVPWLSRPLTELLKVLEEALEADYDAVNQRLLSGGNPHVKLTHTRSGEITWTLPYVGDEETVNHSFFDDLPQIHIASLLRFVDARCQCLEAFTHILQRYVKTPLDRHAVIACLIAYGTNVGLGKMGAISDLSYPTLFAAAHNFLRPETVREANDRVCNATAKLPIFRHYHIDDVIHSSSDGQKFETQIHTLRSRHSPKYFGLKKGITNYTGVANHVPFNARIIGANESESHYVYDLLANNTTDIQPNTHSTDTHGTNEVNFLILETFGYQFAPRYRDPQGKMETLHGFKHPSQYPKDFLLKPRRKINTALILAEENNIKHILASLATKVTRQSVIIGKLSSYARKNRTKQALWELDNLYRSRYLLTYVDSLRLRRNVQRALNRGESYHKLVRAVAYANGGRLRVRTDLEQQLWSECSRFLANCVIHYNACLLSELLEHAERTQDAELADRLKRISPVSWKHVNFYGEYTFQEIADFVDLGLLVQRWLALQRDRGRANQAR
jgi:TnpA family transposase